MDYALTIEETRKLLLENQQEWEERYEKYARFMQLNINKIKALRSSFNEHSPLYYYITTTEAKSFKNTLELDIRYRGQSVASLKVTDNGIKISTKNKEHSNMNNFDCDITLDNNDWSADEARKFRSFFRNRKDTRNNNASKGNEEHSVESLLLTEFLKTNSLDKAILGIQPITFGGIRYSMPTPIKASNPKKLEYAKQYGGGIDILGRTGKSGRTTHLTVIEVKDENKPKEPPQIALNQAIRYATFIRELLRSSCGKDWYNLFGFRGAIPDKLKIRVACAMPGNFADKTFAKKIYPIDNDTLECHYIYFKYDGLQVSDIETSLPQ